LSTLVARATTANQLTRAPLLPKLRPPLLVHSDRLYLRRPSVALFVVVAAMRILRACISVGPRDAAKQQTAAKKNRKRSHTHRWRPLAAPQPSACWH